MRLSMRCDTWLRSMPLGRNWRQPIDVFIAAALPGAVRVGKVHINLHALGKLLMFGHFLALIVGQRLAHTARHMAHAHDLASAIFALASFTAGLVMLAQMGNQFPAQTASWLT